MWFLLSIFCVAILSHVSKALNELSSSEIVICLNPELKRGRVYELTKDGKEIAKQIKS